MRHANAVNEAAFRFGEFGQHLPALAAKGARYQVRWTNASSKTYSPAFDRRVPPRIL